MGFITGRFPEDFSNPVLTAVRSLGFLDMDHGPWVGGGALRRIFSNETLQRGDLDVFLPEEEEENPVVDSTSGCFLGIAERVINRQSVLSRSIEVTLRDRKGYRHYYFQGDNSMTFIFEDMKVQVLLKRRYRNAQALLADFDYTICMAATDGQRWIADDRLFDDLKGKRLVLGTENPRLNMLRLTKYCTYGFAPEPGVLTHLLRLDEADEKVMINENGKIDDGLGY